MENAQKVGSVPVIVSGMIDYGSFLFLLVERDRKKNSRGRNKWPSEILRLSETGTTRNLAA